MKGRPKDAKILIAQPTSETLCPDLQASSILSITISYHSRVLSRLLFVSCGCPWD